MPNISSPDNSTPSNTPKKKSSLISRIKTAIVVLPILFSMFYYSFLYLILMLIVIYISHKEFYVIETHILKQLFTDQFSDSTSSTLISSPLQTYIILLLPLLIYTFPNSEPFSCAIVLFLLTLYRLSSFINIYMLNNTKDFEVTQEMKEAVNPEGIKSLKNPIQKTIEKNEDTTSNPTKGPNGTTFSNSTLTSMKNSFNKQYITEKMMNSCLVVIALDYVFIFTYAAPLCYGISLHHLGIGFTYVSLVVAIAYSCDVGGLFGGMRFGKTPFGVPITPTKTREGIYGGVVFAIFTSLIFRFVVVNMTKVSFFNDSVFILFVAFEIITAIFGDFFESFLKRCANVKDSGTIFPGHGGLLDRIDSITIGLPVCYYFVKLNKVINILV